MICLVCLVLMDLLLSLAGVHDRHELLPHTFRGRVRLRLFADNDEEEAKQNGMSTDHSICNPPSWTPPPVGDGTGATAPAPPLQGSGGRFWRCRADWPRWSGWSGRDC